MSEGQHWNAEKYAADFAYVPDYGKDVGALLTLDEGARVLDLGCGTGAITLLLKERGFNVLGLDHDPEMLRVARHTCPEVRFLEADAADFALEEPVDAVFSNAVLHWLPKKRHKKLLQCVYHALKPGGQFVFEMGAHGNTRAVQEAFATALSHHGLSYQPGFYFPRLGRYARRLEKAGFEVEYATVFPRLTPLDGDGGLEAWMEMFLGAHLHKLAAVLRTAVKAEVTEALKPQFFREGRWYVDYVRLRVKARRV